MKKLGTSALLALALAASVAGCSAADTEREIVSMADELRALDVEEKAFMELLNAHRAQNGLGPLTATPLLNQVAYDHSLDMGQNRYFDHRDLQGRSPFDRMKAAGYTGGAMGENIAAGNSSAQGTFTQWKDSAGHNANMLGSSFRAIGVGRAVVPGSPYTYYWTTVFGDVIDSSAGGGGGGGGGTDAGAPETGTPEAGTPETGTPEPVAKVQLFDQSGYRGRVQSLGVGRYPLAQLGVIGNDSVSSVRVPSTLKLTLYQHDNFGGTSKLFTRSTTYVGNAFNDQASSAVVEPR